MSEDRASAANPIAPGERRRGRGLREAIAMLDIIRIIAAASVIIGMDLSYSIAVGAERVL